MQYSKLSVLFFAVSLILISATPLNNTAKPFKWMTLAEVEEQLKVEKRPILIDLYTDWCGWCKVMDKKTYAKEVVQQYLSEKFYSVKLNAETRNSIRFQGKSYKFHPQYQTNQIALFLTNGQLSYPTTVIIPADGSGPQPIPGFLAPKDLELVVKYFGEGHYGKVAFDTYQKKFKATWK
jgi:thioredoxin-related protein